MIPDMKGMAELISIEKPMVVVGAKASLANAVAGDRAKVGDASVIPDALLTDGMSVNHKSVSDKVKVVHDKVSGIASLVKSGTKVTDS